MNTAAGDHVIWQDESGLVTIIDIPRSIEDAQHAQRVAKGHRLMSLIPIDTPFVMPEPKSAAARTKLEAQHPEQPEHAIYVKLHEDASIILGDSDLRRWCLTRVIISQSAIDSPLKRRRTDSAEQSSNEVTSAQADMVTTDAPALSEGAESMANQRLRPYVANMSEDQQAYELPNGDTVILPAHCSAVCETISNLTGSANLRQALKTHYSNHARFDLVLLDPPWHNASAKRGKKYSTMTPTSSLHLLLATNLDTLMADQCLVCVWITNKLHAREAVLAEGGLFEQWGIQLIEEWIWYKVTSQGELIFPLETITRKPYEVLLVGRKHRQYPVPPPADPLPRRALFAVPDLHSRKPCLKSLLQPLLPAHPLALEVFARYLVSGWWSWGNECVLFNEQANWIEATT